LNSYSIEIKVLKIMVHRFNKRKLKSWLRIGSMAAAFGFLLTHIVQPQVTIGSGNPPAKGALLDLKENEAPNGSATTTKGIIFPRVNLAGLNSLEPLLSAADAADATQKTTHTGIVVYNINTASNLQEGLYCWDGAKWVKLLGNANEAWLTQGNAGTNAANNFVGTTDNQPLIFKVNNTPAGYIGVDGNIGIGTVTPSSTMTVNGSFAGAYREITQTSYNISPADYVVSYNGTAAATFNLPDITTSIAGRTYFIKNLTGDYDLTVSSGMVELRRGGTSSSQNFVVVPAGYYTMIVANTNTSGSVWDILSLQDSHIATTGWILVATDIISIVNKKQTLQLSNVSEDLYFDVDSTALTVTIPAGITGDNRVIMRWDVWGDVTANLASGSVRFAVKELSPAGSTIQHKSIMMTSWSTPHDNYIRWSAPVVFGLENIAPGIYTFSLQARREVEKGTITDVPSLYGIQGKAEVYIK
jgi:hypothetical protein